ncbi:MAG: hypothetical protein GX580_17610 [Candidatus Hydrogenedens sp.]|nr:hypothetical protein [Candidatus Hydrogenedentota bacterium]NLF59447.1 hypothetical protein [Candidatus Hydrogenedens sp.]
MSPESLESTLRECLEDLERRMDDAEESRLMGEWRVFAEGRHDGEYFMPRRARPAPPAVQWPKVRVNQTLESPAAMALQQLGQCSDRLAAGDGFLLNVRANFGTCILPSLFGAELFLMTDEADTLPTNWPLDAPSLARVLEGGVPGLRGGLGGRVLDMGRYYLELFREYPAVQKHVHMYHPDLQGPMDLCELLWGSGIFTALIEEPDRVKRLLGLMTETYTAFMKAWREIVPFAPDFNPHWGFLHRGRIMLRDDSAMNLSPAMVAEFVVPHDQQLLTAFGGGAVHFCGRGDHFIGELAGMEGVHAVNLGQPEMNDLETVLRHTVDRGVNLLNLPRAMAETAVANGRPLRGRVQVS